MLASFNPHTELGVAPHASEREIRDAYRRLAAQWHPDRNTDPAAADRMARINQAYRHLCDIGPASRIDPATEAPAEGAEPPAAAPAPEASASPKRSNRSWWNRDWSKARWEADGAVAPRALLHEATISFEDAAFGCRYRVKGVVTDQCVTCSGTGRMVSRRSDCRICRGEGRLQAAGVGGAWQSCDGCFGDGSERKACDDCAGSGKQIKPRRYYFDVHIPAGVREGQLVVLRGQGQRSPSGNGDIEVAIRLKPHPIFHFNEKRKLCCDVPVDVFSMLAGATIDIPNIDGSQTRVDLSLGAEQMLEGQGFPKRDGRRGPLIVKARSVTPAGFSPEQKQLLARLSESLRDEGYTKSPELAQWLKQVEAIDQPAVEQPTE